MAVARQRLSINRMSFIGSLPDIPLFYRRPRNSCTGSAVGSAVGSARGIRSTSTTPINLTPLRPPREPFKGRGSQARRWKSPERPKSQTPSPVSGSKSGRRRMFNPLYVDKLSSPESTIAAQNKMSPRQRPQSHSQHSYMDPRFLGRPLWGYPRANRSASGHPPPLKRDSPRIQYPLRKRGLATQASPGSPPILVLSGMDRITLQMNSGLTSLSNRLP